MVVSESTLTASENSTKNWLVEEDAVIENLGGMISLQGLFTISQTYPNSSWQFLLQPSPPTELPSSHGLLIITPSPHLSSHSSSSLRTNPGSTSSQRRHLWVSAISCLPETQTTHWLSAGPAHFLQFGWHASHIPNKFPSTSGVKSHLKYWPSPQFGTRHEVPTSRYPSFAYTPISFIETRSAHLWHCVERGPTHFKHASLQAIFINNLDYDVFQN